MQLRNAVRNYTCISLSFPHLPIGMTNHMFETTPFKGLDIVSLNVQRGRDHGLPRYNEWRNECNLGRFVTFGDLGREGPRFQRVYRYVYGWNFLYKLLSDQDILQADKTHQHPVQNTSNFKGLCYITVWSECFRTDSTYFHFQPGRLGLDMQALTKRCNSACLPYFYRNY